MNLYRFKNLHKKSNIKNNDHYQGGGLSGSVYTSNKNQLVAVFIIKKLENHGKH